MKMLRYLFFTLFLQLLISFTIQAQNYSGPQDDIEAILQSAKNFSHAYVNKDYDALANSYTQDGKILPPGADIIAGREAIKKRWILPEGVTVLEHKITPTEIKVMDDHAYDMGYYEGRTRRKDGSQVSWKGKYLIVWKKAGEKWLMHLDIWNDMDLQ